MKKIRRKKPDPKKKIQKKEIEEEKRNSIVISYHMIRCSNTRMDPCSAAVSRGHTSHTSELWRRRPPVSAGVRAASHDVH